MPGGSNPFCCLQHIPVSLQFHHLHDLNTPRFPKRSWPPDTLWFCLVHFKISKKNCEKWKLNGWLLPAFLNPMCVPIFWLVSQNRLVLKEATNRCDPKWVFPKIVGTPPKWMVKIMETPIFQWDKWDDFGGGKGHHLRRHPHDSQWHPRYEGIFCGTSGGATVATALEVTGDWGRERLKMFFWGVVGWYNTYRIHV